MKRPQKRQVRSAVKKTGQKISFGKLDYEVTEALADIGGAKKPHLSSYWDGEYWMFPMETWRMFLGWSKIDELKYVSERSDCDDFAKYLWGQSSMEFGMNSMCLIADYSGGHAYNGILTLEKDGTYGFHLIEPQTDQIVLAGDAMSASEAYTLRQWDMYW